ncbi:MAG: hypothetical protein KDK44_01940 [Chlamydiia bacterium]|nr:hypothetical protein [Chlamydiia bacterium]MCP5509348.1 hypothetical protein [Chlamydiales bacterium]
MDSKSQFNSPDLQKIFKQIEPILTQHKVQLDQVSADIKEVERFLRACSIHFPFRYCCSEHLKGIEEDHFNHSSKQIRCLDYLCWGKSKDGQYRLLYEAEEQVVLCQDGAFQAKKETRIVTSRPLIEAKVKIRLELYPKLPNFLEEMTKALQPLKTEMAHREIANSLKNIQNGRH